ncbi:phage tail tape measure protein, partial [Clostridioides difficile]|nr:phage tail tape measure protein [Clostridioides difficile]
MEYAKKSAQFSNVSDLSQEDSNKYLTSIMSAYGGVANSLKPLRTELQGAGRDYNNLTKFSDLANYAGNNFAVTTGDVGAALQRSASVLAGFGTSMEDSIALVVGMQESTQNAEKTGTALKSIAVNLAGVKASAKEGTLEANKTNKAFKQLANIDIWNKQTGEIKGTMDVLGELNTKWGDLNDAQKNGIAEAAAGKYHINSFVALMNNWKHVIAYQEQYKQGLMVGSADKENERFINSAEGKIIKLKESLKQLVTDTISTDMFKSSLDGLSGITGILNGITKAADKMHISLPVALASLSALFMTIKALGTKKTVPNLVGSGLDFFKYSKRSLGMNSQAQMKELNKAVVGTEGKIKGITIATKGYALSATAMNKATKKGVPNLKNTSLETAKLSNHYKKLGISSNQTALANGKISKSYKDLVAKNRELSGSNKAIVSSNEELLATSGKVSKATRQVNENASSVKKGASIVNNGLKNMGQSLANSRIMNFGKGIASTVGNSLVLTAAFAGVTLLAQAMENYANREENAYQARKKNIQTSKQQINSYESQKTQLQALAEEYDNLSKKENKSKEDNNRLNELKQQIGKIKPDAVIGTDENGIPILKGQVTDLIAEIDRAINAKERLMSYDKQDNAKTAAKKLNSPSKNPNKTLEERMRESETGKLVKIEEDYTAEVEKNKKRQEKAIEKYNNSTGRARDKARNELMSAKTEEEKIYFKYDEMYRNQVGKIQGYSKEIGDGIFSNIKNKTLYSGLEGNDKFNFAGLESLFDFSEVTPDTLVDTEQAVNKLLTAVRSGKVDVGDLSKTLKDANEEFARTQDIEKYNKTIDETAKSIAKATNTDANIWENLFGQVNPNGIKDMTSINTLLAKFGKTKLDLANGDEFAMQLQNQFDSIQNILDTTTITGDVKVDANILTDIKNTKEVPSQVKGMIDSLLGTGASSTDVLKFTMDVLMELQTGDPDITKLQNDLDNKFGKGTFTITPEILLSDDSGQANAEQIISDLKQRYEELPEEVITVIKANPTTTLEEADSVKRIYDKFPEEVKTIIKEEGADEGGRKILDLTSKYAEVPSELKTKLEADGVGLEKAVEVSDIYKKIPPELKTYFIAEAGEALYNSVNLKDALEHIPDEKITEIYLKQNDGNLGVQDLITSLDKIPLDKDVRINIYKALSEGDIDALGKAIESLPPDKRVEIIAEIEKAKDDIKTISSSEIENKIFTIEVKDLASDAIEWIQNKLKEIKGDDDKKDPVEDAKDSTKKILEDKPNPKSVAFSRDKEAEKLVDDILNTPPTKQIELKLKKNEELKNTLNSFKELEGRDDVKLKLESSGIETEQVKVFADIVKNLPADSTFTNKFVTDNVDSLKNLKDYEAVQKWLMDNPTVAMDYSINLNGLDDFDKMKSIYDGLEDKKDKKVFAEVVIKNPEKAEAFQKLYDNAPEETKSKVVSFAVKNADELERATKLYESTPDEQKNQVLNFMLNNEDKLYLIDQLYNDFPESKDIIANLIVNNPDALDEVENLNALDLDKDVKINIIKSLANGDINSLIAEIENLPPEKQVEVIAAVEGAIEGIDSVDKKTIKDKWAKLKANNSAALATIRQTENKKLTDKSFTITAHLRTVGTLGGIASQFANNILDGLNSNRKSVQSINSTETPQPIPANLSSQPRTSEPVPISDETPVTKPSLFSRAVSRAAAPIKALKTLTQDTPIDKNFDAIIKYEIELFKELENQLSKVTNELSLLDKQMKNATNEQKLNYLKKQNELYKEQERLLNRKEALTKDEANRFKKVLS